MSECVCLCEKQLLPISGDPEASPNSPSLVQLLKLFLPKVTPPPHILSAQKLMPEVRRSVAWDGPPGAWSHREGGAHVCRVNDEIMNESVSRD